MNKQTKGKIFRTVLVVAGLGFLWLKQAPLAYFVAQQRVVLLGRYTIGQMTAQMLLTPILLLILWGIWTAKEKTREQKKEDAFRTIAVILSILLCIVLVDVVLRIVEKSQYVQTGHSYHRLPDQIRTGTFIDQPVSPFTYPNAPAGYPPVDYTFTTDRRGFRNQTDLEACDAVVLGDSFAEGSGVSDEDTWAVRLAEAGGRSIYNLGMSGTSAVGYLDLLEKYGLPFKPKLVICLLYEGNDFRDSNFRQADLAHPEVSLGDIIYKASPVRRRIKDLLIRLFSPVGSRRFDDDPAVLNDPDHLMYPVAWLPMNLPVGSDNYYTFDLKRLLAHCVTSEQFSQTLACRKSLEILEQLQALCGRNQARLVVVYAPDKPHVLLEASQDTLSADQARAFMALKEDDLPPADELLDAILPQMDTFENVVREFCEKKDIRFISLTGVLRKKMLEGTRAYFTYDQHWSPEGHRVVADYLAETISFD